MLNPQLFLDPRYALLKADAACARNRLFQNGFHELGQGLTFLCRMSFCPLEQLRFNLDIELRPCHQTAQDTSVYAGGGGGMQRLHRPHIWLRLDVHVRSPLRFLLPPPLLLELAQ